MDDLISREAAIDAIDEVEWYHQGADKEMISGASLEEEAWYKAEDVYGALQKVPSVKSKINFSYKPDELLVQFMLGFLVGVVIMMVIFTR